MKIPVMKIFKESFKDVKENKIEWLRVATAPVLVYLFGLIFMFSTYFLTGQHINYVESMTNPTAETQNMTEMPFMVILGNAIYYILYIIIMINGYRYAALKEGGDRWWTLNLNRRFVRLVLFSLLVALFAVIYVSIAAGIIIGAAALIENMAVNIILGLGFVLFGIYAFTRIGLAFFLVALDQTKPIRLSWALLKGNVLRMIGLFFIIEITIGVIAILGLAILGLFGWLLSFINGWLSIIAIFSMLIFGFIVWFMNWAITAKAVAFVYKNLTESKVS